MSEPSAEGMVRAAEQALSHVESGMWLGLGTGRAAEAFIRALAARVARGLEVTCLTTSVRSQTLAESLSLPTVTVVEAPRLDIAFDGADEVTPELDLTKGLGGALLRERVVASLAERFVILVTPEKRVPRLATRAPIPVEVVPFAEPVTTRRLGELGEPTLRQHEGRPFRTDNGNVIVDVAVAGGIDDPVAFDRAVRAVVGVVDTGLFLGMAERAYVGTPEGVEVIDGA